MVFAKGHETATNRGNTVKHIVIRRKIDIEAVISTTPESYKARYRKVLEGEATRGQAIKVKCAECVGFTHVVEQISNCTTYRCPIWDFRPFKAKGESEAEVKTHPSKQID